MGAFQRRRNWVAPLAAWLLLEAIFAGLAIWAGVGIVLPALRALLQHAVEALASRG